MGNPLPGNRERRRGFTLVELLVVAAVIGLLLGIALPAVVGTRETANATVCANNLRQIGLAMHMFAETHDGKFPSTYHDGDDKSWIYTLAPFMENVDEVRCCPLDSQAPMRLENDGTSYVINGYIAMKHEDSKRNIDKLSSKSHTITVFEGANARDPKSFNFEHTHPWHWFVPAAITQRRVWSRAIEEIQADRHWSSGKEDQTAGMSHYLYADGHVELFHATKVKAWADEGNNFAKPQ